MGSPGFVGSFCTARNTPRTSEDDELMSGSAAVPVIVARFVVSASSGPTGKVTSEPGGVPSNVNVARETK
ncbi:MAG: hypothetical protein M0D55_01605 [Elusimicrobiota bacterium]|nr:MAG: hypothetical protein M0D55_01605 [Elusimicrobiota bacterium]